MATRSESQSKGSQGEALVKWRAEKDGAWICRLQVDDFGVDFELELANPEVSGHLVKGQAKAASKLESNGQTVSVVLDKKYLEIASNLRVPFICVWVDLTEEKCWYLWLQEWLLEEERSGRGLSDFSEATKISLPRSQTLDSGLKNRLRHIARFNTSTQLALSIRDALKTAIAVQDIRLQYALVDLLGPAQAAFPNFPIDAVIDKAVELGDRLRGTPEGNTVGQTIFEWIRAHGNSLSIEQIVRLVLRGESYSRVGITALDLLYEQHFDHAKELDLPEALADAADPRPRYYCLLREAFPELSGLALMRQAAETPIAGFRFAMESVDRPWDKWANRGGSAILDYLVEINEETGGA